MFGLTDVLAYYFEKFPFVFDYFDFLRDLFLAFQLFLILVFIFTSRKKTIFFYYLFIFLFAFSLAQILKNYFPEIRPISFYSPQLQLFDSFPSRHTLISFSLSLALIFQNFRYGILSLTLTFLIALFSWLSLRHWPVDIFAGFVLSFFVFLISREILYFFHRLYTQKLKKKS